MRALILGGTGLIGAGVVKHLLARGAAVTAYNRGRRGRAPSGVVHVQGDRADRAAFERVFERSRFDVVVDMICFDRADAESTVRAFGGRCEHLVLCSTVCTYGGKIGSRVLIDETFPQEPLTGYGRSKLECERVVLQAAEEGRFHATVVRPSHTYGPGGPLLDQLELSGVAWDRVQRGLPVLCAGDGLGLWQSTHRDDCSKLFAHAALEPRTYEQAYNATRDEVLTWRDYYRTVAGAMGTTADLVFCPARWLIERGRGRFGFLEEITRHHGAYSSEKAKAHVPAFRPSIGLEAGARETLEDVRRRGAWPDATLDAGYQRIVDEALAAGFGVERA